MKRRDSCLYTAGARVDRRWRAFACGFLLAATLSVLISLAESFLSFRQWTPTATTLFYGINLHLLIALLAVLAARLVFWRLGDKLFPPVAVASTCLAELLLTASYWFLKGPWAPPLAQTSGKFFAAATLSVCGLLGLFLIWFAVRRFGSSRWARLTHGRFGFASFVFLAAFLICNGVLTIKYVPWPKGAPSPTRRAARPLPDVIIILVDTLRWDHLSFFGYPRPTSRNLDELFGNSYVFKEAYTPSNKTVPSVASFFTCLYPTSHAVTGPFQQIPEEFPTLAEHFHSYGYQTAAFVANQLVSTRTGFARGFHTFLPRHKPWWYGRGRTAIEGLVMHWRSPRDSQSGSRLNRELFAWLDTHRDGPRFVYIHYMEPHSFYEPPQSDYAAVAQDIPRGPLSPPLFHQHSGSRECEECIDWRCLSDPPVLSEKDLTGMIACYDGEIHLVDRYIGQVIDELRSRDMFDNAHIVFLSDHGEEFGDHDGWFHGHSIYDELTRCPLAYRPPGGVPGGSVIERPLPTLDLLETLIQSLGLESMSLSQGAAIPELLGEQPPDHETPVVSALPPHFYSFRLGPWKLIRRGCPSDPEDHLYNVTTDPAEQIDLALSLPDTLAALRDYLGAMLALQAEVAPGEQKLHMDPETLKQLRSLGYVQ